MENNLGLTNVDIEKLYSHVYELEGIRHPLTYPIGLERAAKYIEKELESYGYITERQFFQLPGFDEPFYNIQGYFSDGTSSDVLVTSHYDTVHNTPGADDSASSVAIMLETARIISDSEYKNRLKVISFTLEEGNPVHEQAANIQAQLCGLIDDQLRPTSFGALEKINLMWKTILGMSQGNLDTLVEDAAKTLGDRLNKDELAYFRTRFRGIGTTKFSTPSNLQGSGLMGSQYAAMISKENSEKITGVLNLETIGYTDKGENSQKLVAGIDPADLMKNNTDEKLSVGDFAFIVSDLQSQKLGQSFFESTQENQINLASAWLHVPLDYQTIVQNIPDILGSDHASYWKQGYSALLIVDSANFRNPNYHTPGDTINTLDFEFMKDVCKSTVSTVSKMTK